MRRGFIFLLIGLFIGTACRLDYSKTKIGEEMEESIPETILIGIVQTTVKKGNVSSVLSADRIETYKNKNIMTVEDMHYRQMSEEGELLTEGWADKALLYTDTENAEIAGEVHFYSHSEEAGIYADHLDWNNQAKVFKAPVDEIVTIARDDGSYVQGYGFKTDLSLKVMTFSGRVGGEYIENDDEENDK